MPKQEHINSYKYYIIGILDRMKWDFNLKSHISRRRIKKLKNLYHGKKAVILCNGPSLNKVDFKILKNPEVITFGLNKINLLFDSVDFRPSYIVAINDHVIDQNKDFFNSTDIPLFLKSNASSKIKFKKNVVYLHASSQLGVFAKDISMSICEGFTVTYVALQLAYHMGFNSVGLVGCDHTFATKGHANKLVEGLEKDENHFHPNYFDKTVKWQLPDLYQSEAHYNLAKETYEEAGRNVYNCTEGGKLEIFRRKYLEEFLEE